MTVLEWCDAINMGFINQGMDLIRDHVVVFLKLYKVLFLLNEDVVKMDICGLINRVGSKENVVYLNHCGLIEIWPDGSHYRYIQCICKT